MNAAVEIMKANEAWALALLGSVDRAIKRAVDEKSDCCNLRFEDACAVQVMLTNGLSDWRDAERLNWLDRWKKGQWAVRVDGVDVGTGYGVRAAINDTILRVEGVIPS